MHSHGGEWLGFPRGGGEVCQRQQQALPSRSTFAQWSARDLGGRAGGGSPWDAIGTKYVRLGAGLERKGHVIMSSVGGPYSFHKRYCGHHFTGFPRAVEVQLTALKPCGTGWTVLEKTLLLEDSEVSAVFASEPSDPALGGVLQV